MTNSADPVQLANWSVSTLFAKTGHIMFSKKRVNVYEHCTVLSIAQYLCMNIAQYLVKVTYHLE